jgi:hypothetical protein
VTDLSRGRQSIDMRLSPWICTAMLAGCYAPPVETPKTTVEQSTPIRVWQTPQNKVDVLFMVDNSPSMAAMQDELKMRFGDFFQVFTDLAARGTYADLQIGVVTSDYGAGPMPEGNCTASPGGQLGNLQQVGLDGKGCAGPTDKFIKYAFHADGAATGNLPGGNTPDDLVSTFTCMASGGAAGCGFEHQLESVYAALKVQSGNQGFLRDDALLVVVFLTNEDDGSAPPMAQFYSDKSDMYGAFDTYRQTRYAIACGDPATQVPYAASNGPLVGCVGAANPTAQATGAYDLQRYIDLFTKPKAQGGIKINPLDVILVGIDAPEWPFETILAQSGTGAGATPSPAYVPCTAIDTGCEVHLQHSCQNMAAPAFFGDPPVRLNTVIRAAKTHQIANICGDDPSQPPSYSQALQDLAKVITDNIGDGCIPEAVLDTTAPDCVVDDDTPQADGTIKQSSIPSCTSTASLPCWKVEVKPQCAATSPQSIGLTVERGQAPPPAGTYLDAACSTIAAQGML